MRSPAFADGQPIPAAYTCTGKEISPPLSWSGVPKGARSLRLEMDDETANFVHWKVRGIAPDVDSVAAGAVPKGGKQGRNSFHKVGYGGRARRRATSPSLRVHHHRGGQGRQDAGPGLAGGDVLALSF